MSRLMTMLAIGMVIVVSIWMQDLAMRMLGPGTPMWESVATITWPVDGEAWVNEMYTAITVWFIWIIRVGAVAIGFYREFLNQNVTRQARVGGVR